MENLCQFANCERNYVRNQIVLMLIVLAAVWLGIVSPTDLIEYSEAVDLILIDATIAWIQVHDSRIRAFVKIDRGLTDTSSHVAIERAFPALKIS